MSLRERPVIASDWQNDLSRIGPEQHFPELLCCCPGKLTNPAPGLLAIPQAANFHSGHTPASAGPA